MDERAQNTIRAIETRYKGYRFRSRLEARWAVVLDHLGIEWEYEPEGYETSAGWYLPDFRIDPQCVRWPERFEDRGLMKSGENVYLEVKGKSLAQNEAERIRAFASDPGEPRWLFALGDIPSPERCCAMFYGWSTEGHFNLQLYGRTRGCVNGLAFLWKTSGKKVSEWGPTRPELMDFAFHTRDRGHGSGPHGYRYRNDAFAAGRAARFEHGESGA